MLSRFSIACLGLSLVFSADRAFAVTVTYQYLPAPPISPANYLEASATSGTLTVGSFYSDNTRTHSDGYIFNGSTYTILSDPAANLYGTYGTGVSGNTATGFYYDSAGEHGFLYDIPTGIYTTFNDPAGNNNTSIGHIEGDEIAGYFGSKGFVYDLTTGQNTVLSDPLARDGTVASDIFGNFVVGSYYDANTLEHGFLYNMSTGVYTTIDDPSAITSFTTVQQHYEGTDIGGISSQYLVGGYNDTNSAPHGFIYNLATGTFSPVVDRGGVGSSGISGIAGNVIVGGAGGQAFIATLPEPSSLVLAALGTAGVLLAARRRKA